MIGRDLGSLCHCSSNFLKIKSRSEPWPRCLWNSFVSRSRVDLDITVDLTDKPECSPQLYPDQ
jgi:hypothetical protein